MFEPADVKDVRRCHAQRFASLANFLRSFAARLKTPRVHSAGDNAHSSGIASERGHDIVAGGVADGHQTSGRTQGENHADLGVGHPQSIVFLADVKLPQVVHDCDRRDGAKRRHAAIGGAVKNDVRSLPRRAPP
jgi:hypothetical protein